MPLPAVQGWIIDHRTAEAIFSSGSNVRINHCVDMCQAGQLHICHCEEDLFRSSPSLCGPFIIDQYCICEPDDDIVLRCGAVSANPNAANLLTGNEAALYLTAIALAKNYGVISDHRSFIFATVFDLCTTFGVHILSADEYFAAA